MLELYRESGSTSKIQVGSAHKRQLRMAACTGSTSFQVVPKKMHLSELSRVRRPRQEALLSMAASHLLTCFSGYRLTELFHESMICIDLKEMGIERRAGPGASIGPRDKCVSVGSNLTPSVALPASQEAPEDCMNAESDGFFAETGVPKTTSPACAFSAG